MYSPTMHYHVSIMDPSDPLGMPAYETTDLVNVSRDVASGEYDAFVTFGDDDDAVPARIEVRWTRVEMTSVVDGDFPTMIFDPASSPDFPGPWFRHEN